MALDSKSGILINNMTNIAYTEKSYQSVRNCLIILFADRCRVASCLDIIPRKNRFQVVRERICLRQEWKTLVRLFRIKQSVFAMMFTMYIVRGKMLN